jgi:CRISPR type III-A-associated protein Csm2
MNDKRQGLFQGGGGERKHQNQTGKYKKDFQKKAEIKPVKTILFRDDKNHLKPGILVEEAKKFADDMANYGVSFTQLRSFFNEILTIKERMTTENKTYEEMAAIIGMLISKAHYRMVREPTKNTELYNFINSGVHSVKSKQDYLDFALLFEAVVGFFPRKK